MDAPYLIDWDSRETHVRLNPRLPEEQRLEFEALVDGSPRLERHVWLATSGSTGVPKMTALSKDALLASAAAVNRHLESTAADTWHCVLPTFHVGGLGIYARASLSGARVVAAERWDARAFLDTANEQGVTLSALVPAQVVDLVEAGALPPPHLRAIVVGGGPLNAEVWAKAVDLGWPLLISYGMTECCSQIATAEAGSRTLTLLDHVDARTDPDGRLCFRSAALLTGYALRDERGVITFTDPKVDGWFTAEDRGEVRGRILVVAGRGSDFIKIGGESVDLARLTTILESVAGGTAALVAVPDSRLGHVLHLVAEAAGEETARAFDARVLPYERIRRVHTVERLPRTELGKIRRNVLLAIVERKSGSLE